MLLTAKPVAAGEMPRPPKGDDSTASTVTSCSLMSSNSSEADDTTTPTQATKATTVAVAVTTKSTADDNASITSNKSDAEDHSESVIVDSITRFDVVCGRGRGEHERWPGTIAYREYVRQHREEYNTMVATKNRPRMIEKIMDCIFMGGRGRFVQLVQDGKQKGSSSDQTGPKRWVVLPVDKIRKKVSDDLRRDIRRERLKINQQVLADGSNHPHNVQERLRYAHTHLQFPQKKHARVSLDVVGAWSGGSPTSAAESAVSASNRAALKEVSKDAAGRGDKSAPVNIVTPAQMLQLSDFQRSHLQFISTSPPSHSTRKDATMAGVQSSETSSFLLQPFHHMDATMMHQRSQQYQSGAPMAQAHHHRAYASTSSPAGYMPKASMMAASSASDAAAMRQHHASQMSYRHHHRGGSMNSPYDGRPSSAPVSSSYPGAPTHHYQYIAVAVPGPPPGTPNESYSSRSMPAVVGKHSPYDQQAMWQSRNEHSYTGLASPMVPSEELRQHRQYQHRHQQLGATMMSSAHLYKSPMRPRAVPAAPTTPALMASPHAPYYGGAVSRGIASQAAYF